MTTLTEIQKQLLKNLLEKDDEYSYSYAWITDGITADRKTLTKEMRGLRELGLVEMSRGQNEDGQISGTGFGIVYSRKQEVKELLGIKEE